MAAHRPPDIPSPLARLRSERYQRGYLEGCGQALIRVLELRGVVLRAADRDFILACPSIDSLDHWTERVWEVTEISELFSG